MITITTFIFIDYCIIKINKHTKLKKILKLKVNKCRKLCG